MNLQGEIQDEQQLVLYQFLEVDLIFMKVTDGNWVQFNIGIGGLALDVATLGSGSLIKGGVKAIGTELVEGGIKK